MWELNHKEGWVPKNWCFWIVVLGKTLSPLDSKEIKPVNPKRNHAECWLERLMLKLKLQYSGHVMWRTDSGKDPGKDWCWERLKAKGKGGGTGWNGWMASPTQWIWIEQTLGDSGGQRNLECCSPWGYKESDTTQQLNNDMPWLIVLCLGV